MLWLIIIGIIVVIITIGLVVVILVGSKPRTAQPNQEIVQRVERGGKVELEKLECRECGAELEKDSIIVEKGITFISCSYCGSTYQLELVE
jgi:hypothetical protein